MAVTFDAALDGHVGVSSGGAQTTHTISFTGAAGASILVGVQWARQAVDVTGTTWSVTYNGVTMSSQKRQAPTGSTTSCSEVFGLLNCCDGSAHNLTATVTGGNSPALIILSADSATGATGFNNAVSSAPGSSSTSGTLTVTSTASDLVFGAVACGANMLSGPTNGTERTHEDVDSMSAGGNAATSTTPGAASALVGSWTASGADLWTLIGVNMAADVTVPVDDTIQGMVGPGSVGDMAFQWQQDADSDSGIVSEDHPTDGLIELGTLGFATYTHDVSMVGLLEAGVWPASTVATDRSAVGQVFHATWPTALVATDRTVTGSLWHASTPRATVTHDVSVAALVAAGEAVYATVSRNATVTGLVEHGTWPSALITSTADITTAGIGFIGTTARSTVARDANVTGLVETGVWPDVTAYSKDSSPSGLIVVGNWPDVTAYSKNSTPTGLVTVGVNLASLITGSVDISTAGVGFVGATVRSTVSTDRTATGHVAQSTGLWTPASTARTVTGLLEAGAFPVAVVSTNRNIAALILFGVTANGLLAPLFVIVWRLPDIIGQDPGYLLGRDPGIIVWQNPGYLLGRDPRPIIGQDPPTVE